MHGFFNHILKVFHASHFITFAETISLPPRGSGKVCVQSNLPRPPLLGFHLVCCCITTLHVYSTACIVEF
uniref:Putative ovule protein n=1 Tax=Solanum chacoense TaxID=4108 RepID=A0A0V0H5T5_SOLCH